MEELEQARWLAPRNEEDRRWLRRERLKKLSGAGLFLIGFFLMLNVITLKPGPISCAVLVFLGSGVSGTIVFLFVCCVVKDSDSRPFHIAGWVWFAAGVALWLLLLG